LAATIAAGRLQHITITASSGLAKDEVDKMVKEAAAHASEDKQRREEVEARNTADAAIFTAEKALREGGDKVPADVKSSVETKVTAVRKALESAEDANRVKSDFLAVMSHELRTPLNAIAGHVQLIEMGLHGPITEAQRDALGRVQRSQHHLLALINDLLNLSRAEAGRVELAVEEIAVEALLSDVVRTIEPLLLAGHLTSSIDGEPGGGVDENAIVIRADRERVNQILLNLLTNAIKFTPAGGHIGMRATRHPTIQGMARIQVCDTGIGIPEEKLDRIFEPFVQLRTHTLGQGDGVGLGLAISRTLARAMGGDLTAASEEQAGGATLTLTLPLA